MFRSMGPSARYSAGWDPVDLATAREEEYPAPAENPMVRRGTLQADLARRDFTINALALDLVAGELIDLHHGLEDLVAAQLRFLHSRSVQDDPTRVIRAARYAARLDFQLEPESSEQIRSTIARWPWSWCQQDAASAAPPALASRLRSELHRLLAGTLAPGAGLVGAVAGTAARSAAPKRLWRQRLRWPDVLAFLDAGVSVGAADPVAVINGWIPASNSNGCSSVGPFATG